MGGMDGRSNLIPDVEIGTMGWVKTASLFNWGWGRELRCIQKPPVE